MYVIKVLHSMVVFRNMLSQFIKAQNILASYVINVLHNIEVFRHMSNLFIKA